MFDKTNALESLIFKRNEGNFAQSTAAFSPDRTEIRGAWRTLARVYERRGSRAVRSPRQGTRRAGLGREAGWQEAGWTAHRSTGC